jgi:hypothetical protein
VPSRRLGSGKRSEAVSDARMEGGVEAILKSSAAAP